MSGESGKTHRPAAFLDRDGTIVRDVGYARSPDDLELLPGAAAGIEQLRERGFLIIVITNQSGIGRGMLTENDYQLQVARLDQLLGSSARPDAHYHCPHHPTEALGVYKISCSCRKPAPGLFLKAAAEWNIDMNASIAVGDSPRDIEAARAAGIFACARIGDAGLDNFTKAVDEALRRLSRLDR
ncbi:MAG: HAD family hydrolase [Planctomycetes bacterium]|nr:HAD family hydrolase [Planctomycetota bacterium]